MHSFAHSIGSSDSTTRAMALTIAATASKPITITPDHGRSRRPSRLEVTQQLLQEIAAANDSPPEHAFMGDESIVVDKNAPELSESTQGTYMLKRRGTNIKVGVFKPSDEEVKAADPAVSFLSPKQGVVVGDGAIKEHAAYVLDHGGFAGVPRTETVVFMEHELDMDDMAVVHPGPIPPSPKRVGSFQEFREHMCTSEDLGSSLFSVEDVHHIGLLDLRLFNLDRHLGNILVQLEEGRYRLIPIDHGYILPSFRCMSDAWFCWTSWKQSSQPFSPASRSYIAGLTPFADIAALKRIGLRDECILTFVLCTVFVKEAVVHNWTLKDMALAMQRDICIDDAVSDFEMLVNSASSRASFNDFEFHSSGDAESWGSPSMLAFLDEFEEMVQKYVTDPRGAISMFETHVCMTPLE